MPKKKKPIKLTEKDEAVLRAIEELGETADMGKIRERADEIYKEMQRKKLH